MEYKGATIAAMIIFALLFVGAVVLTYEPSEKTTTAAKTALPAPPKKQIIPKIPDGRPNERDADANPGFIELPSGLRYRILRKSETPKPTSDQNVAVHYRGWLDSGTEFDSSYTTNRPFVVSPPWGVIDGWKEGLLLMGEGGMIELEIPANLGYGARGSGKIPANATLHFEVEILKVY